MAKLVDDIKEMPLKIYKNETDFEKKINSVPKSLLETNDNFFKRFSFWSLT